MSNKTRIYEDEEIVLERGSGSQYFLTCLGTTLSSKAHIVKDQHDVEFLSFKPKQALWWDLKLFRDKKVPIGVCAIRGDEVPMFVQGVWNQKLFYGNAHILSRNKGRITRGPDFDLDNPDHLAVMLLMAIYDDQRG